MSSTERTFDMSPSPSRTQGLYRPLAMTKDTPGDHIIRLIAEELLNHYAGKPMSRSKWRKAKGFTFHWRRRINQDGQEIDECSKQLTFDLLCAHLKSERRLDTSSLNLPALNHSWMDSSVASALNFHAPCNEDDTHLTIVHCPAFVTDFPIAPALDREGVAFSNVILSLQNTLLEVRRRLVAESELLFDIGPSTWLRDLMTFLNAAVSVVEVTLNLVYYKAKHEGTALGWRFDADRLGSTHSRRLTDKLAWIGLITGKPLDDAQAEVRSFMALKEIRNHLHHFDPPVFAYTIEDVAGWLNRLHPLAVLLWKIRQKLSVPLSAPLVEMLLCPRVEFLPLDPGKRRTPQPSSVGYSSCKVPRP